MKNTLNLSHIISVIGKNSQIILEQEYSIKSDYTDSMEVVAQSFDIDALSVIINIQLNLDYTLIFSYDHKISNYMFNKQKEIMGIETLEYDKYAMEILSEFSNIVVGRSIEYLSFDDSVILFSTPIIVNSYYKEKIQNMKNIFSGVVETGSGRLKIICGPKLND